MTENELRWRRNWADVAYHESEKLRLIGFWQDIVGFYCSDSGIVWGINRSSPTNHGDYSEFVANFKSRFRGVLLSE